MENICESAQTDDCAGNHPRSTPPADVSRNVRHVLEDSSGDGYRRPRRTGCLPKKSPKKPINRMCLGEESTDNPTQSGISTTGQRQMGPPRYTAMGYPTRDRVLMSSPLGQAVRTSKLGTCHCLPYYVHLVHTSIPGGSSSTTENILCGGDPPRGLSDETTSLGAMATAMERKANSSPSSSLVPGRLLLGENTSEGQQGCGPTGRTARIGLQAIQQHLPKALDFIVVYVFRWPCYQIQVDTPVDIWSNHARQVALSFPASALLAQVGRFVLPRRQNCLLRWVHSFFPGLRKCTPRQPREHVNQQAASCPRSAKAGHSGGLAVTGFWARNAP